MNTILFTCLALCNLKTTFDLCISSLPLSKTMNLLFYFVDIFTSLRHVFFPAALHIIFIKYSARHVTPNHPVGSCRNPVQSRGVVLRIDSLLSSWLNVNRGFTQTPPGI